jgi:hypothetical protein
MDMRFIIRRLIMMVKKITKVLVTSLVTMLAVLSLLGCPGPTDPSYGSLSGGPQRNPGGEQPIPETPDILIYGVKLGKFAAEEGGPGLTIAAAAPGSIFLGEEATEAEVTGLAIDYLVMEGESISATWTTTGAPNADPDDQEWNVFPEGSKAVVSGVFPSGSYLVFKVTNNAKTDEDDDYITYYKYLVTWGQNGVGIESISIAGRTFIGNTLSGTTNIGLGIPYIGEDSDETEGRINGTIYLTSAQIVANRPIEVNLRSDSRKAYVTFGSSNATANGGYPANDTTAIQEYRTQPPSAALVNNSRIYIRVRSLNGDVYANYRIQVTTANQAVIGTFTTAKASTAAGAGLGTPCGSWDAEGLVDGTALAIKSTRIASAIADHSGGSTPGVVTWAFTPDLATEPEFVALAEPQNLAFDGYIYVRAVNDNYMNIYRFPVTEKPLSDDPALSAIRVGRTEVGMGTFAATWEQATNSETVELFIHQMQPPVVMAVPVDSDVDNVLTYAIITATITSPTFTSTIPSFDGDGSLLIKVTPENGGNSLFYRINITRKRSEDATLQHIKFGSSVSLRGVPSSTTIGITAGSVDLYSDWTATSTIDLGKDPGATVRYALTSAEDGSPAWSATQPAATTVTPNNFVWFEITAENGTTKLYYKVKIVSSKTSVYGRGVPDPDWVAKYPYFVFPNLGPYELLTDSIGTDGMPTKMPNVSYWSSVQTPAGAGHLHEFVDPFHFANGNRVTNIADWENRRKEIRMIVGYYQKGYFPSLESEYVDIWLSGTNNTTINIRHKASGRTQSVNATVTANPSAMVSGREGKLGVGTGSVSNNWGMAATAPNISTANIQTLYGITGIDVLTRDSTGGWNNSLHLIAIEGTSDPTIPGGPRQEREQYYYPVPTGTHPNSGGNGSWFTTKGPLYATGTSTGGKQAMHAIVWAHGRKSGTRAGFVNIGDSGAHGHMTEKMHYQVGLRLDVSAQEALRLSGFSEAYISANLAGLPDNSSNLGPRQGHAATMLGANRTSGFYNVNPDGTLKMAQYSVRGQALTVRGSQPYGWTVSTMPDNAVGFSKRETGGSNGGMEDTWGTPWYHTGIRGQGQTTNLAYGTQDAILNQADRGQQVAYVTTMANGPETGMPSYGTAAESNQVVRRERLARGWSPYFEAFNAAPQSNSNTTMEFPLPNGENYIEVPYTAWFSMIDGQQNANWVAGFGTWLEDQSVGTWNNSVSASFPANHTVDGFDYPGDVGGGWQCSIPTASYYQAMLDAPYGVQVHAYPTMQNRTNDYGSFATWVVVDEIYKMYGEAEGNGSAASNAPAGSGLYDGWDKYLYNNMQDYWWGNHAGMQGAASPSMTAARTRLLEGGVGIATPIETAKSDITIARFRDPHFLVDDPYAYISDWHKMHISRPRPDGTPGVPISERIGKRVTPLLKDFFQGEIYHNAPARYGPTVSAITYHDAAQQAITAGTLQLNGPKYKPMDWRGLLDNPEVLP